jgi:hypothetical protein
MSRKWVGTVLCNFIGLVTKSVHDESITDLPGQFEQILLCRGAGS